MRDKIKFVVAMVLLISGLSTVYFGSQFMNLQTGGTTIPFEWFEYKSELRLSLNVFVFTAGWAIGWMVHEVLFIQKNRCQNIE